MLEAVVAAVIIVLVLAVAGIWFRLGALEQRLDRLESGAGGTNPSPRPAASPSIAAPLSEIEAVLLQGKKILAVKIYRDQTGVGLKEAKDAVDEMERRLHIR
jgi:ribosomal protein L7/L12